MSARPAPALRLATGSRRGALSAAAAILAIAALLMVPAFSQPGAELDEGLLVTFPAQMLDGSLPHRDFYDPYGPAGVWTVAAADELFGARLATERAVGMTYRLAAIAGAFGLALCWGLGAAVVAGATVAALLVGSVGAPASVGFLALALLGYALLARALLDRQRRPRLLAPAGALLGASLLMRYDFLPVVVVAVLPAVTVLGRRDRRRFAAGAAAGLAPFAVHLALVGPDGFWRSARLALGTRGHPTLVRFASDLAEFVTLYGLATVLALAAGLLIERRARRDPEARLLLGGGLAGVALAPFALTHVDEPHLVIAAAPVLAMLPAAALTFIRGDLLQRPAPPAARRFALAAVAVVIFFCAADAIRFPVFHEARYLLSGSRDPAFEVRNGGRSFKLANRQAAVDVQAMIAAIARLARPGDSLFVGPRDLRTAGANDVYLYFLLDRLRPASYFTDVDLHTINRTRNGFSRELLGARFLILTTRLTGSTPTDLGPPTANEILATRFCVRAASGSYALYERCR